MNLSCNRFPQMAAAHVTRIAPENGNGNAEIVRATEPVPTAQGAQQSTAQYTEMAHAGVDQEPAIEWNQSAQSAHRNPADGPSAEDTGLFCGARCCTGRCLSIVTIRCHHKATCTP
jgi:hypothetical protein